MAIISESNTQFNLPWLNSESIFANNYEPINFRTSFLGPDSTHRSRVRIIKGLEGSRICVVDTDDILSQKRYSVHFPPNQYAENKINKAARNFHMPIYRETTNLVTARPTLDTMLAMKFFTGLRNMSFKDQQMTNINPMASSSDWETKLHELTAETLMPMLEKFKDLEKTKPFPELERCTSSSSMKRMYSSSGRILTSRSSTRPLTCPAKRPSTSQTSSRQNDDFQITPELDTQVFYILGGILQNPDPEVVKTWLLTSTEREKSLMIAILRSALMDKDELNMFVAEASKEPSSRIIYTPAKGFNATLPTINENVSEKKPDILIVRDDHAYKSNSPFARPPTSSTFRTNKTPTSRPPTRSGEEWIQSESVVIK